MKIEITEKNVFMAVKGAEQEVPVGTIIESDTFPGYLVGKARIVGGTEGKTLVTGIDELRARYEALTGKKPHPQAKAETLQKGIAEAEAKQLDDLRTRFLELTGNLPADEVGAEELTAAIADIERQ